METLSKGLWSAGAITGGGINRAQLSKDLQIKQKIDKIQDPKQKHDLYKKLRRTN